MKKARTYFCVSKKAKKKSETYHSDSWKLMQLDQAVSPKKTSSILTSSTPINLPKQLVKCWKKSVIKNRLEETLENEEICERSWLRGWGIDGVTGLGLIHGAAFLISAGEKPKRGINYAAFPTISFLVKLPRSFRITAINRRSRACGLMHQARTERSSLLENAT